MDDNQTLRSLVRDDSYHVERVLAEGPSGRTELVTLDGEGPLVRKRIPAALANAAAWAAVMEVDDPLIPHIESLYRMPDELVVVYDYVEGESLAALVAREGPLAPKRAVRLVRDVCHAADVLHGCDIVHRDITPGNVIVARDGRAHLTDLGIARHETPHKAHDTRTLGTLGFAAPEQFGFAQSDARTDVFALGRLLGYVLTGTDPTLERYNELLADAARVPAALAGVAERAASFEPSARYQNVRELDEALVAALDEGQAGTKQARATKRAAGSVASFALEDGAAAAYDKVSAASARAASRSGAPAASTGARAAHWDGAPAAEPATARPAQTLPFVPPTAAQAVRPKDPAPLSTKIILLLTATWLNALFWTVCVCICVYGSITKGDPNWGLEQYMMGVIIVVGLTASSWEVTLMILRRGAYEDEKHLVYKLVQKILIIFGLALVLMMLAVLLLPGPK